MNLNLTSIIALLLLVSCSREPPFDEEQAIEDILKMHYSQRDFHFDKDSLSFVKQFTHDFTSVNAGVISFPSKSATQSRYHRYFSSVNFLKWDDVQEPLIRFSKDGTLAYTVVDKLVAVEYKNEHNETRVDSTHFAWIAIYRNTASGWKIESVASTNKP